MSQQPRKAVWRPSVSKFLVAVAVAVAVLGALKIIEPWWVALLGGLAAWWASGVVPEPW